MNIHFLRFFNGLFTVSAMVCTVVLPIALIILLTHYPYSFGALLVLGTIYWIGYLTIKD